MRTASHNRLVRALPLKRLGVQQQACAVSNEQVRERGFWLAS